jgi:hypothetical protein
MLQFPFLEERLTGPAPHSLPSSARSRFRPMVPLTIGGPFRRRSVLRKQRGRESLFMSAGRVGVHAAGGSILRPVPWPCVAAMDRLRAGCRGQGTGAKPPTRIPIAPRPLVLASSPAREPVRRPEAAGRFHGSDATSFPSASSRVGVPGWPVEHCVPHTDKRTNNGHRVEREKI